MEWGTSTRYAPQAGADPRGLDTYGNGAGPRARGDRGVSWLRVDDGFGSHPKLLELTREERWTWVEILCHCARHRTGGLIAPGIRDAVRHATPAFLAKTERVFLSKRDKNGRLFVHDWDDYNPSDPTAADRMRRYRERQEQAKNERKDRNEPRNEPRNTSRNETVTRAHGSRPVRNTTAAAAPPDADASHELDELDEHERTAASTAGDTSSVRELRRLLDELGVTGGLRAAAIAAGDEARVTACARAALERQGVSNRAGYFRRLMESGEWPAASSSAPAPVRSNVRPADPVVALERMIRNRAIVDRVDLAAELEGAGIVGEPAERLRGLLAARDGLEGLEPAEGAA